MQTGKKWQLIVSPFIKSGVVIFCPKDELHRIIYNGNRTEWSPIRSVILRVINKIGRPWSGSPIRKLRVWLQTELDDTTSCYQLIKTITEFGKETRHRIYFFIKKKKTFSLLGEMRDNSARTWRDLSTYTGMTRKLSYYTVQLQAWRVDCPIGAQIGLVITHHVRKICYSFD